jgi:hypothetical protein
MLKRAFFRFSRTTVSLAMFSFVLLGFGSCQKYYYLNPDDIVEPCALTKFTCTVDNNNFTKVTGTVEKTADGTVTESSNWGTITYNGENASSNMQFVNQYRAIDCEIDVNSKIVSAYAVYDFSFKLESIDVTVSDNLLYTITLLKFYRNNSPNVLCTIDNIKFRSGNLISYSYEERLANYPYTILVQENYSFNYRNELYKHSLFPNEKFFTFNYRPILGDEYSLGERFDPQPFSKNLVARKYNLTESENVFENTYNFDSEGRITQMLQEFTFGGNATNTLNWTYQYTCQ